MRAADKRYSRLVAWLKILLPLIALGILSTLFLVSRKIDPTNAIPFTEIDIKELAREHRIGGPVFTAMTNNGSAVAVKAEKAVSMDGGNQKFVASGLSATIESPDGATVTVVSPVGEIDAASNHAELSGGVVIDTSKGYHIETDRLLGKMDMSMLESPGPITGEGPLGHLEAGKMVLTQQSGDGSTDGYVLFFTEGVKVVYVPQE